MADLSQQIQALSVDPDEFPKLSAIRRFMAAGLSLADVLHGARLGAGDLEDALGDEWRRLTDGVDRELSAALAEFALGDAESVADHCFLRCQWAVSLGQLGRHAEAVEVYDGLLERLEGEDSQYARSWSGWTYNGIAYRSYLGGDYRKSVEAATRAVEVNEGEQGWRNMLSLALHAVGEEDRALAELEKVLIGGKDPVTISAKAAEDPRFISLCKEHGAGHKVLGA